MPYYLVLLRAVVCSLEGFNRSEKKYAKKRYSTPDLSDEPKHERKFITTMKTAVAQVHIYTKQ